MHKVLLELDDSEYSEFIKKLNGRTQRETVLDYMNIPHEQRILGRPSIELDELRKSVEAHAAERREADEREIWEQSQKKQHEEMKRLGIDEG